MSRIVADRRFHGKSGLRTRRLARVMGRPRVSVTSFCSGLAYSSSIREPHDPVPRQEIGAVSAYLGTSGQEAVRATSSRRLRESHREWTQGYVACERGVPESLRHLRTTRAVGFPIDQWEISIRSTTPWLKRLNWQSSGIDSRKFHHFPPQRISGCARSPEISSC